MDIRSIPSDEQKKKLRKIKELPDGVKSAVYSGATDPKATIQFGSDLRLYGLYEALLYVETYEEDGYYVPGTAENAMKAACVHVG